MISWTLYNFCPVRRQQVLNYSALQTGLAFLPQAIAAMVAAPISSHLVTRFGTKMTLTGSMTLTAVGLLHLSRMPVRANFVRDLLPGSVIIGFGMVMTLVAVTIAATSGIQDREQGLASGLLNTSQRMGAALGLALLSSLSTSRAADRLTQLEGVADAGRIASTAGFRSVAIGSVGFAIVGLLVALFMVHERDCRGAKAQIVE